MKKLAVIGDPIEHSLSPVMHQAALNKAGLDDSFEYKKIHVSPENLARFMKQLKLDKIHGINITIPHKSNIIPFLDKISETVELTNAVNTVVYENINGNLQLCGYNTDVDGFLLALDQNQVGIKNKHVLLLGSGGSALSVAYGLLKRGANVEIKNRTQKRADSLVSRFSDLGCISIVHSDVSTFDCIVNCTSVGMNGVDSPLDHVDLHAINDKQTVIDIIYTPVKTPLLLQAELKGAKTINGLDMLVNQGALAFKRFTTCGANVKVMKDSLLTYLAEMDKLS